MLLLFPTERIVVPLIWKRFDQIVLKPGYRWYGKARVWQEETLDTYVSLVWDTACEEPWLLISDQGAGRRQVQEYAWRLRVEATFQDSKSRGVNIEASWIVDRTHLDRLLPRSFLPCGGPRIWQRPVSIMALIITHKLTSRTQKEKLKGKETTKRKKGSKKMETGPNKKSDTRNWEIAG